MSPQGFTALGQPLFMTVYFCDLFWSDALETQQLMVDWLVMLTDNVKA